MGSSLKNPAVSIIIPVHNTEEYLRECLNSAIQQTLTNIEIICVDDCSTDQSTEILQEYERKDSRIQCILHKKNVSASQCRKDGVMRSAGEYIMFMDADDYLEPNACQVAYDAIVEKQTDILQFDTFVENCGNLPEARIEGNQKMLRPYTEEILTGFLLEECFVQKKISVGVWNKIFKGTLCKEAFACVEDGYFPKANDLYSIFFLLYKASSFAGLEVPLYHYCFGRGMTGQNVMSLENFTLHCKSALVWQALKRYCEHLPEEEKEKCEFIVDKIRRNFLNEQCNRWLKNLETEKKHQGLYAMSQCWNKEVDFVFSALANYTFYNRIQVAEYLQGARYLEYTPRKIKTIALYYRSIFNGGAQRVVAQLCNLFAQANENGVEKYKVVLVTDDEPTNEDYELFPQVERFVLPHRENFPKEDYYMRAQAWKELIDKYHVDVVLDSMWVDSSLLWDMLCVKSHSSHPAFVIHTHSFSSTMYRLTGCTVEESFSSYAIADAVITLSQCDQKYWAHINPQTYCIVNPCHLSAAGEHRAKAGKKNILWLGRISLEKQPMDVIKIMKRVVQEVPDAVCHLVGSGDEKFTERLTQEIEQAGLSDKIILEGFHNDVETFYENASVFLATSSYEGFGLTLFEAAAYGVPAVTYDLPWLEFYTLIQGWAKVPQRDYEGAAQEIIRLLSDDMLWKWQSDQIYRGFEMYKQMDLCAKWEEVFLDLENETAPQVGELDEKYGVLLRQIARFHQEGISKLRADKNRCEKKLQQTYQEKSEINRKLQITYAEKFERGLQIKELRREVEELRRKNEIMVQNSVIYIPYLILYNIKGLMKKGLRSLKNLGKKTVKR